MRLAMLQAWPDQPNLDLTYTAREGIAPRNAVAQFISGLSHDDSHLEQVRRIVIEARKRGRRARQKFPPGPRKLPRRHQGGWTEQQIQCSGVVGPGTRTAPHPGQPNISNLVTPRHRSLANAA